MQWMEGFFSTPPGWIDTQLELWFMELWEVIGLWGWILFLCGMNVHSFTWSSAFYGEKSGSWRCFPHEQLNLFLSSLTMKKWVVSCVLAFLSLSTPWWMQLSSSNPFSHVAAFHRPESNVSSWHHNLKLLKPWDKQALPFHELFFSSGILSQWYMRYNSMGNKLGPI